MGTFVSPAGKHAGMLEIADLRGYLDSVKQEGHGWPQVKSAPWSSKVQFC